MRARKRFGQHFLEPAWVRKVVEAVDPLPGDGFLEIGPGRGALTVPLAGRAAELVGIEVDRDLAAALPSIVPANVRVVTGDVLQIDLARVADGVRTDLRLRVAGNLPYNISTPIVFALLALRARRPRLVDATLMLQKEVVDRLAAGPGSKDYGVLGVLVGRLAQVDRLLTLPPGAFRPPPEVTSAVVRLAFRAEAEVITVPDLFEPMVRAVFTRRRKTMGNALAAAMRAPAAVASEWLTRAGIDPQRRPETLAIEEFAAVARTAAGARPAPPA